MSAGSFRRVLLAWALLASGPMGAQQAAAPDLPTVAYPDLLPPEAEVRSLLAAAPEIIAARESVPEGLQTARKLRAGQYEWELSALGQRRTDPNGISHDEQQFELGRRVRLPGKFLLDRRMAQWSQRNGEAAYADAWHEAGRALLARWFEWLRASEAERLLSAQAKAAEEQARLVQRRVSAGDAAPLDLDLAQAEALRLAAMANEAAQSLEHARYDAAEQFPGMTLRRPVRIPDPVLPGGGDEAWIARIESHNHEIELAEGTAAEARLQAQRAAQDRIPDPMLGLQFSSNIDQNRDVVGLRVTIPLGYTQRSAEAALARSRATRGEAALQQARLRVLADARRDLVDVRQGQQRWQQLSAAAARADMAAARMAKGQQAGEFGMTEVLSARRSAMDAQLAATEAAVAAHAAQARLLVDAHLIWTLEEHDEE